MSKIGDYVSHYLRLRDKVKAMDEEHAKATAPYKEAMAKLEDYFQKQMEQLGLDNLKAEAGVAYASEVASVTTPDKIAFLDFVKEHDAWHLLDIRPGKSAVGEYVEENGTVPPGVDYKRLRKINVRKA